MTSSPDEVGESFADAFDSTESVDLGTAAETTVKAGVQVQTTLEHLEKYVSSPDIRKRIEAMSQPPEFDAVMGNPLFAETIDQIMGIVETYKEGQYNPVEIEKDILKLGSLLVYFGSQVNYTDSLSADATSQNKQAQERAYIEAKIEADRNHMKVSSDALSALASVATENYRAFDSEAKTTGMTVRGFYFSAKALLEVMNAVAGRSYFERRQAASGHMGT